MEFLKQVICQRKPNLKYNNKSIIVLLSKIIKLNMCRKKIKIIKNQYRIVILIKTTK